jgi:hypothetical protein
MANPNPQHNPTDGLAVAAYVQVTSSNERGPSNLTNPANGGLTVSTEATAHDATGLNGQGYGAVAGANHPQAQYQLQLSLSNKTIGGVIYSNTSQLTAVIKDVANTTYTPRIGSPVYKSYGAPATGGFFNPSNAISGNGLLANQVAYNARVASVSATGLVTARAVGQCIVEVQFPVFDNVMTPETDADTADPTQMIYVQIVVNVVP